MTSHEARILDETMLELLSDRLSTETCTDLELIDEPDNRHLVARAETNDLDAEERGEWELHASGGTIYTDYVPILDELRRRFRAHFGLESRR